jgi:hypothetical protein
MAFFVSPGKLYRQSKDAARSTVKTIKKGGNYVADKTRDAKNYIEDIVTSPIPTGGPSGTATGGPSGTATGGPSGTATQTLTPEQQKIRDHNMTIAKDAYKAQMTSFGKNFVRNLGIPGLPARESEPVGMPDYLRNTYGKIYQTSKGGAIEDVKNIGNPNIPPILAGPGQKKETFTPAIQDTPKVEIESPGKIKVDPATSSDYSLVDERILAGLKGEHPEYNAAAKQEQRLASQREYALLEEARRQAYLAGAAPGSEAWNAIMRQANDRIANENRAGQNTLAQTLERLNDQALNRGINQQKTWLAEERTDFAQALSAITDPKAKQWFLSQSNTGKSAGELMKMMVDENGTIRPQFRSEENFELVQRDATDRARVNPELSAEVKKYDQDGDGKMNDTEMTAFQNDPKVRAVIDKEMNTIFSTQTDPLNEADEASELKKSRDNIIKSINNGEKPNVDDMKKVYKPVDSSTLADFDNPDTLNDFIGDSTLSANGWFNLNGNIVKAIGTFTTQIGEGYHHTQWIIIEKDGSKYYYSDRWKAWSANKPNKDQTLDLNNGKLPKGFTRTEPWKK